MEWHPARWLMCLPLLIFPCIIKSRSSLLAPAHPGGPGKRAVKWLWCGLVVIDRSISVMTTAVKTCLKSFIPCNTKVVLVRFDVKSTEQKLQVID